MRASTRAALAAGVVTALFFGWLALELGGARTTVTVDNVGLCLAALVAAVACGWAARGGAGRQWLWLSGCSALWASGQAMWTWYELVLDRPTPFPSLADVGFLGAIPLGLAGLLAFPACQPLNRFRAVCDGVIVALSVVGAAWARLLAPIAAESPGGLEGFLGLAYPVTDIVLIVVALTVAGRTERRHHRPMAYVISGIGAVAAADCIYGALVATGRYSTGQLFDAGWMLGFLLVATGAVAARRDTPPAGDRSTVEVPVGLRCAPYFAVVPLIVAIGVERLLTPTIPESTIYVGVTVAGLVVLRQFLVEKENGRLTERLRLEAAEHRATAAALTEAQAMAHLGSWEAEMPAGDVRWSDEMFRILGYEPRQVTPSVSLFLSHVHSDDLAGLITESNRARQDSRKGRYECRIVRTSGDVRWTAVSMTPTFDAGGALVRMHGTLLDITEIRETRDRLGAAERRLEEGFAHSPTGMALVGLDSVILDANPALCDLVGRSREELVGRSTRELAHPSDHAALVARRAEVIAAGHGSFQFETRLQRPDGQFRWIEVTSTLVPTTGEWPPYFFSHAVDMSARKAAEAEIAHRHRHDAVTGAPNRTALTEALIAAAGEPAALILLDIENFGQINQSLGHGVGDRVLTEVAQRLRQCRAGDFVARVGSDEFAVLIRGTAGAAEAQEVAATLLHALERTLTVEALPLHIRATAGIALGTGASDTARLLARADLALYTAKESGVTTVVCDDDADVGSVARLALVARLREAIAGPEFTVHYQPKIEIRTGRVVGVEALARWVDGDRGPVSPGEFIPLAEQSGLIAPMTRRVLDEALSQLRRWRDEGIDLEMAVNISPRLLTDPELPAWVAIALQTHGIPGGQLILEITENAVAEGPRALEALSILQELGVRLSIDDLGTGYSSLAYLKRLPVDELKIDRAFITDIAHDERDRAIVQSIVGVGRSLGLTVTAEGVEDAESLDVLRTLGCEVAQGYHCCRPTPGPDLTGWLASRAGNVLANS
ncbi:MAG: EAL domain-containing protein [Actinomycetota bacterium]|jgi:diguanylate cyclase (GGDEF)-like protein/PAS domain S-box-containing protein